MKYYVSIAATEATLANGRPLVRGDNLDLSKSDVEDPFNYRLITEGQLIPTDTAAEKAVRDAGKSQEQGGSD